MEAQREHLLYIAKVYLTKAKPWLYESRVSSRDSRPARNPVTNARVKKVGFICTLKGSLIGLLAYSQF